MNIFSQVSFSGRVSGRVWRGSDGIFNWDGFDIPPLHETVHSPKFLFGKCLWDLAVWRRLNGCFSACLVREKSWSVLDLDVIVVTYALGWRKAGGVVVEEEYPHQKTFNRGDWDFWSLVNVENDSHEFLAAKTLTCRFIGGEETEPLPKQIEEESDALKKQLVEAQSTISKQKREIDSLSKKVSETEAENVSYKEEIDAMREKLRVFESTHSEPKSDADLESLSSDLRRLLTSGEKSDVILNVQGREFRAHRVVMAARSPVFRATFCHDSEEERTEIVEIPDCDPESFPYLLQFLYSGKVDEMTFEAALGLYQSADKYGVQALKSSCTDLLRRNLTPESVCDIAVHADLHSDEELISAAQMYFDENYIDVLQTSAWMDWMQKNPRVAAKLLKEMAAAGKK